MASQPPVNPIPQQWTPPPRKRSIFGPVVLIGMGIVLLLVSSGRLSAREFFKLFADYWPVVLIVWGAIKLVEYMQAKREGYPAPGIGGGGIVLLIFLILFGTAISAARRGMEHVNWNTVRDNMQIDDNDFETMFGGNKYEFSENLDRDFPANAQLKVVTERGNVTITPSSDNKMHVTYHKAIYADNQDVAKKVSDSAAPAITVVDNIINVDASHLRDFNGGRLDLQISVPRKAAVDLMTLKGAVSVTGRDAEVKAHSSNGDINVEDVTGNVSAHMRGGNFNVKKVKGEVSLEGRGDEVSVTDATGRLTLQGEYNSIQFGKLGQGAHFNSSRTDMEFGKLDGELNMSNGELRANSVAGPFRVSTRSKDVNLEDVTGEVKIDDTNGSIQITPKLPVANIDITNKNGEVTLMLPPNGNFSIDASSQRGEIQSEFDLENAQNPGHEAHSTGNVGKGGPKVSVRNDHGTIHIRKR